MLATRAVGRGCARKAGMKGGRGREGAGESEREVVPAERARKRNGVLAMLSTLEGELPRTRGPNPLFWTHTLAHLSLAPDHLQLALPRPVHPCRTYCRLSCLPSTALRLSFHPQRQTRHIARSVALLPRRASPPVPRVPPRPLRHSPALSAPGSSPTFNFV